MNFSNDPNNPPNDVTPKGSDITQTSLSGATQPVTFDLPPSTLSELYSLVGSGMVGGNANDVVIKAVHVLALVASQYAADPTAELAILTQNGKYVQHFTGLLQRPKGR